MLLWEINWDLYTKYLCEILMVYDLYMLYGMCYYVKIEL